MERPKPVQSEERPAVVGSMGVAPRLSPLSGTWALLHSRSAFKRLFLHKSKDKKYSLEGAEEAEATGLQPGPLEAATKKHLEGASRRARGAREGEGRWGADPGDLRLSRSPGR